MRAADPGACRSGVTRRSSSARTLSGISGGQERIRMSRVLHVVRHVFPALAFAAAVVTLAAAPSVAETDGPATHHVARVMKIGGEGGWDYATLDASGRLLFLPRSTHAMVIDAAGGKTVADFGATQRAHGVALVPEASRGFLTDGKPGSVVVFDLNNYAV